MGKKIEEYLKLDFGFKNRREKYEAIKEAWELPVSPLEERNWLSWFTWRKSS